MKKRLLFVLVALVAGMCAPVQAGIYLDHVDGLGSTETQIRVETDVRFHIGLFNDQSSAIIGLQHGFQVYSPDGASWRPITLDTANLGWPSYFNLGIFLNSYSVTGSGADTVSMGAIAFSGGFPPGYDEVILYIETEVYPEDVGRHLCLDSAWFPPGGSWLWGMEGGGNVIPSWDGPHCWEIWDPLNNPPVITNNPFSLVFDHCVPAYYDFEAFDQEGDPFWFELLSGPGTINTSTGEWDYMPSLADVEYAHELVVRACDEFGCGPEEMCNLTFTNEPPVFVSPCPDEITVQAGLSVDYQFTADPVDCDPIVFYIVNVDPPPVGTYVIDGSGLFVFNTDPADGGFIYEFTVAVSDGLDEEYCILLVEVLANQPPVITNNPGFMEFSHCDMAYYDYDATDPEGDPLWFNLLAGPGTIEGPTGVWVYQPSIGDVGMSHQIVVEVCDDNFGCDTVLTDLVFTNEPPVFVSPCPDTASVMAGDDLIYQFVVDNMDCDPSTFAIIGVDPTPVGPYSIIGDGEFTFESDALDEGIDYTFTVEVSDGLEGADCILVVRVTSHYQTLPGVTINQIDFLYDNATQYNSEWGGIEVDVNTLLADQGADRLYLNAVVDGEWAIQNLIIDSLLADFIKTYFGLRIPPGTNITELPIDIQITLAPLTDILGGTPVLYPIGARGFNAEGVSIDGESNDIIPTIMPPGLFDPIGETYEWVWKNLPGENVQAACNQCVPMSVANSLQWLENTYPSITIDQPHVPGLRGDTSLVGQLGEAMERAVTDRAHGSGVSFRKMLQGKLKYLKDNGLENTIVNRHQVDTAIVRRGWLDSATVHLASDSSVTSANETAPNGRVSWDWIYQQIEDGEDVELIYGYYNNAGLRRGGHAVRVFGAGKTNGRPWLMVKHDALQTDDDPGDTLGLQEWFQWVDTLDDGTMTFGSTNQKVDFALSESPADHETTLHFYQLDLMLDDILYTDLDWGELDLTLTPQADTGLVYLNVTVNGSWQVENMPIWPPTADEGSKTRCIAFDLGVPAGSTITYINYGYSLTSSAVSGPPAETGITVVANRKSVLNRGAGGVPIYALLPARRAKAGEVPDPTKHSHKKFPNQDCERFECAPTAVSNSLKFLNDKHNMDMDEADLSIGKMDTACGFVEGWGCPRDTWWILKKRYLEKNKIPVTTDKITDLSKLAAEIDAGQDVELQGDWHTAAIVSITDLGDGKYEIEVAHDKEQGKPGSGPAVDKITYDPATNTFEGSPGFFDGSSFRYAVVECPKVVPTLGTNRNSEDGYTPQEGSPVGRVWHEKHPNYCTWWAIIDWEDNGDDWFGYGDYVTFFSEMVEEPSREHIEEVTATITVVAVGKQGDTTYLDFWYGRPDMDPIIPEEGDLWHEVWPEYCTMHEVEWWEDNGSGYLDSCDNIAFRVLTGPDAGTVQEYHVVAIETDVISTPAPPTTCCIGELRGNIDMDPADQIDISDLVFIVDYMFNGGPEPPCFDEADMNCDGVIDISDLVWVVDYMFTGGPPPCRCDCADCPQ